LCPEINLYVHIFDTDKSQQKLSSIEKNSTYFYIEICNKLVKTNTFSFQIFLHDFNAYCLLFIMLFIYYKTLRKPHCCIIPVQSRNDPLQTSNKPQTNLEQTLNKHPTNLQQTFNRPYKEAPKSIIFSTTWQNPPQWTATKYPACAQNISYYFRFSQPFS